MMNRIILGLGLGFMMWFSLFFMPSVHAPRVKITPRPVPAAVQPPAPRPIPPPAAAPSAPARRGIASIPAPAATLAAAAPAPRLSLAELRRLTFEKHQDLFARLIDPVFKPWAWLADVQPHRRAQMQNFLSALRERGAVWSAKQMLVSGHRTYEFETDFRIIDDPKPAAGLRARVDLRVRFDGQELAQTSFEDEARISSRDGRPYAMFDLSSCPTDLNEHFAIVLLAWPDGHAGSGDFRVLSAGDERWYRSPHSSWVELAADQAPDVLPTARSEACAFTPSWH